MEPIVQFLEERRPRSSRLGFEAEKARPPGLPGSLSARTEALKAKTPPARSSDSSWPRLSSLGTATGGLREPLAEPSPPGASARRSLGQRQPQQTSPLGCRAVVRQRNFGSLEASWCVKNAFAAWRSLRDSVSFAGLNVSLQQLRGTLVERDLHVQELELQVEELQGFIDQKEVVLRELGRQLEREKELRLRESEAMEELDVRRAGEVAALERSLTVLEDRLAAAMRKASDRVEAAEILAARETAALQPLAAAKAFAAWLRATAGGLLASARGQVAKAQALELARLRSGRRQLTARAGGVLAGPCLGAAKAGWFAAWVMACEASRFASYKEAMERQRLLLLEQSRVRLVEVGRAAALSAAWANSRCLLASALGAWLRARELCRAEAAQLRLEAAQAAAARASEQDLMRLRLQLEEALAESRASAEAAERRHLDVRLLALRNAATAASAAASRQHQGLLSGSFSAWLRVCRDTRATAHAASAAADFRRRELLMQRAELALAGGGAKALKALALKAWAAFTLQARDRQLHHGDVGLALQRRHSLATASAAWAAWALACWMSRWESQEEALRREWSLERQSFQDSARHSGDAASQAVDARERQLRLLAAFAAWARVREKAASKRTAGAAALAAVESLRAWGLAGAFRAWAHEREKAAMEAYFRREAESMVLEAAGAERAELQRVRSLLLAKGAEALAGGGARLAKAEAFNAWSDYVDQLHNDRLRSQQQGHLCMATAFQRQEECGLLSAILAAWARVLLESRWAMCMEAVELERAAQDERSRRLFCRASCTAASTMERVVLRRAVASAFHAWARESREGTLQAALAERLEAAGADAEGLWSVRLAAARGAAARLLLGGGVRALRSRAFEAWAARLAHRGRCLGVGEALSRREALLAAAEAFRAWAHASGWARHVASVEQELTAEKEALQQLMWRSSHAAATSLASGAARELASQTFFAWLRVVEKAVLEAARIAAEELAGHEAAHLRERHGAMRLRAAEAAAAREDLQDLLDLGVAFGSWARLCLCTRHNGLLEQELAAQRQQLLVRELLSEAFLAWRRLCEHAGLAAAQAAAAEAAQLELARLEDQQAAVAEAAERELARLRYARAQLGLRAAEAIATGAPRALRGQLFQAWALLARRAGGQRSHSHGLVLLLSKHRDMLGLGAFFAAWARTCQSGRHGKLLEQQDRMWELMRQHAITAALSMASASADAVMLALLAAWRGACHRGAVAAAHACASDAEGEALAVRRLLAEARCRTVGLLAGRQDSRTLLAGTVAAWADLAASAARRRQQMGQVELVLAERDVRSLLGLMLAAWGQASALERRAAVSKALAQEREEQKRQLKDLAWRGASRAAFALESSTSSGLRAAAFGAWARAVEVSALEAALEAAEARAGDEAARATQRHEEAAALLAAKAAAEELAAHEGAQHRQRRLEACRRAAGSLAGGRASALRALVLRLWAGLVSSARPHALGRERAAFALCGHQFRLLRSSAFAAWASAAAASRRESLAERELELQRRQLKEALQRRAGSAALSLAAGRAREQLVLVFAAWARVCGREAAEAKRRAAAQCYSTAAEASRKAAMAIVGSGARAVQAGVLQAWALQVSAAWARQVRAERAETVLSRLHAWQQLCALFAAWAKASLHGRHTASARELLAEQLARKERQQLHARSTAESLAAGISRGVLAAAFGEWARLAEREVLDAARLEAQRAVARVHQQRAEIGLRASVLLAGSGPKALRRQALKAWAELSFRARHGRVRVQSASAALSRQQARLLQNCVMAAWLQLCYDSRRSLIQEDQRMRLEDRFSRDTVAAAVGLVFAAWARLRRRSALEASRAEVAALRGRLAQAAERAAGALGSGIPRAVKLEVLRAWALVAGHGARRRLGALRAGEALGAKSARLVMGLAFGAWAQAHRLERSSAVMQVLDQERVRQQQRLADFMRRTAEYAALRAAMGAARELLAAAFRAWLALGRASGLQAVERAWSTRQQEMEEVLLKTFDGAARVVASRSSRCSLRAAFSAWSHVCKGVRRALGVAAGLLAGHSARGLRWRTLTAWRSLAHRSQLRGRRVEQAALALGGHGARLTLVFILHAWARALWLTVLANERASQQQRAEELMQRVSRSAAASTAVAEAAEGLRQRQGEALQRAARALAIGSARAALQRCLMAMAQVLRQARSQRRHTACMSSVLTSHGAWRTLGVVFGAWVKVWLLLRWAASLEDLAVARKDLQGLAEAHGHSSRGRDRLLRRLGILRERLLALTALGRWRQLCFGSRDEWLEMLWKETSTLRARGQEAGRNMADRVWTLRSRHLAQLALTGWRRQLAGRFRDTVEGIAAMATRAAARRASWLPQALAAWAFQTWRCACRGAARGRESELQQMRLILRHEREVRECQMEVSLLQVVLATWRRLAAVAAAGRAPAVRRRVSPTVRVVQAQAPRPTLLVPRQERLVPVGVAGVYVPLDQEMAARLQQSYLMAWRNLVVPGHVVARPVAAAATLLPTPGPSPSCSAGSSLQAPTSLPAHGPMQRASSLQAPCSSRDSASLRPRLVPTVPAQPQFDGPLRAAAAAQPMPSSARAPQPAEPLSRTSSSVLAAEPVQTWPKSLSPSRISQVTAAPTTAPLLSRHTVAPAVERSATPRARALDAQAGAVSPSATTRQVQACPVSPAATHRQVQINAVSPAAAHQQQAFRGSPDPLSRSAPHQPVSWSDTVAQGLLAQAAHRRLLHAASP